MEHLYSVHMALDVGPSFSNRGDLILNTLTLLDNLKADTGLKSVDEIARLMEDRKLWRIVVNAL